MSKTKELYDYDYGGGLQLVCGIDEAGRGPLAGPVAAAACVMDKNIFIDGINDSKKISEKKREVLFDQIINTALSYHICMIYPDVIDEINILQATKKAMSECVSSITVSPQLVIIDHVDIVCNYKILSIIKGDATSYNVAAASILAKVARDRYMAEMDIKYPEYGFKRNKGYGTKEHIDAIKKYGATPIHRRSFIKNFV